MNHGILIELDTAERKSTGRHLPQQLGTLIGMPASSPSYTESPSSFCQYTPRKAANQGSSTWVPHMGDSNQVPGCSVALPCPPTVVGLCRPNHKNGRSLPFSNK